MANVAKAVSTSKVLLVPYEKHHVHKYHTWMQDPVSSSFTHTAKHIPYIHPLTPAAEHTRGDCF